jgi:hypothetical protein
MTTYLVTIPITGCVSVKVEASDEKRAIEKALKSDITIENIEEISGDVFHNLLDNIKVEEY